MLDRTNYFPGELGDLEPTQLHPEITLTRRCVLHGMLASLLSTPSIVACSGIMDDAAEKKENEHFEEYKWNTLPFNHEKFDLVIDDSLPLLDLLYENMREHGSFDRTEDENRWRRSFLLDRQYELLKPVFNEAVGRNFKLKKWKKSAERHKKWAQEQIDSGNFIAMEEDNPNLPYFAQQVGRGSGLTDNNPDMLWMRKEFLPIMGTLVALVNYQIDLLNEDPAAYGRPVFVGNPIPHISAIKISGAYRTLAHHASLGGIAAKKWPSAHIIGHALDIAALQPSSENFKVVRFVEPFFVDGIEELHAGAKLSTNGFGRQTRVILSRMIGRALACMEDPLLDQQGITLKALWETSPLNWHLTMKEA